MTASPPDSPDSDRASVAVAAVWAAYLLALPFQRGWLEKYSASAAISVSL